MYEESSKNLCHKHGEGKNETAEKMGQTAEREQRYKDATVPQRMNLLYSHETWDREEPQD